jgi:hypothetical protein
MNDPVIRSRAGNAISLTWQSILKSPKQGKKKITNKHSKNQSDCKNKSKILVKSKKKKKSESTTVAAGIHRPFPCALH